MAENPTCPVWLLLGKEPVLVERMVGAVVDAVRPSLGPPAFNLTVARLSEGGGGAAIATARTLPMMAARRLVVIRELEKGEDAFFESLLGYLAAPSPSTTLVVSGAGFPAVVKGGKAWGQRVGKAVAEVGTQVKLSDDDVDPVGFVIGHAASLGHALDGPDARLLVELVGGDLGRLAREVEKVALSVDAGAPITAEAVQATVSLLAEAAIWDLTAGIVGRDPDKALAALHRLVEDGEAPHMLLGMVGWQLRTVLRVADMQRQQRPEGEIREALRLGSDNLGRIRRLLDRGFPGAGVVLSRLARANRSMNSHKAGDRRVLEALVLDLATGTVR